MTMMASDSHWRRAARLLGDALSILHEDNDLRILAQQSLGFIISIPFDVSIKECSFGLFRFDVEMMQLCEAAWTSRLEIESRRTWRFANYWFSMGKNFKMIRCRASISKDSSDWLERDSQLHWEFSGVMWGRLCLSILKFGSDTSPPFQRFKTVPFSESLNQALKAALSFLWERTTLQ